MARPYCFILMPFGQKRDSSGRVIDFDQVHSQIIVPAVLGAGLEPIRADQEIVGGIIHKAMFERLILCPYAIADLTSANANVYYELGVRHAIRPYTTVLTHCATERLQFDVASDRSLPYAIDEKGRPTNCEEARSKIQNALESVIGKAYTDSPIYQLLDWVEQPGIDHAKTDIFRDQVHYSKQIKRELDIARREGTKSIIHVEKKLGDLSRVEAGILIDVLLSYRAVEAWNEMLRFINVLPEHVTQTVLVREQKAFALNRYGDSEGAENELKDLIAQRGASSETFGLLGRVYKDRWEKAFDADQNVLAKGLLEKAIDTYVRGFEADFRDAYPGVNAVTLMEIGTQQDNRQKKLLPVVQFAVEQRVASTEADYWDYATLLELAVLAKNEEDAQKWLAQALVHIREPWEPKTTLRNLRLIREAREKRGETCDWYLEIEAELDTTSDT